MVKTRRTQPPRNRRTVGDRIDELVVTVGENHTATVERLATIEAHLTGLPKKVEKLEAHRNWLAGALAVLSLAFTAALHFFGK
jgi:hypothetical protein